MVTKAELYLNILLELERSSTDILASAIVTLDGLTMASTAKDTISKDSFAAYSAAAYKRADDSMEELSGEKVDMLVFESKNHRIFSILVGNNALLIVMTGRECEIGNDISELRKTAGKIEELLK
jgi:predicted regulator of Ras-like GTPase activity (Roadblock/LC7/MglB family)